MIMLSAQNEITRQFKVRSMRATIFINIHDELCIDAPPEEATTVDRLLRKILPNPPYFHDLCTLLGRTVPLAYEIKNKA
jgi:DNA polymerase I-like protein with 3'-5' exonuclease and polymerase domains